MADQFHLTREGVEKIKKLIRENTLQLSQLPSGRKRRIGPVPKAAKVAGAMAILTTSVDGAEMDGANKTGTFGKKNDAATLVDYKRDSNGDYEFPLVDFEPLLEKSGTGTDKTEAVRTVLNLSKTIYRASEDEPMLVMGYEQTVKQGDDVEKLFIIPPTNDLRAFPGLDETGDTEQGPYLKEAGPGTDLQLTGALGHGECETGA